MWKEFTQFLTDSDFWNIVLKILITAILSGLAGLIGTAFGKLIAKCKHSKIYRYAKTCVEAAEMKFPNEGTKMGPEKMAYVMDQLAIKFPKIKDNRFLYNMAEAAVYQLNEEKRQEEEILQFMEKYGEDPLCKHHKNHKRHKCCSCKCEENADINDEQDNSNSNPTDNNSSDNTPSQSEPEIEESTKPVKPARKRDNFISF